MLNKIKSFLFPREVSTKTVYDLLDEKKEVKVVKKSAPKKTVKKQAPVKKTAPKKTVKKTTKKKK